jgi:hypothetical protein
MTPEQLEQIASAIHEYDRGKASHPTTEARIRAALPRCPEHDLPCPFFDQQGRPFCIECVEAGKRI